MQRKNKKHDLYEDALMDICKKQKLPEDLEKLLNADFDRIHVNKTYVIDGVSGKSEKKLVFGLRKTDNFPGDELYSDILNVEEYSNEDVSKAHRLLGQIFLTYHEDLGKWLGSIHLFDEEKETNRVENLSTVLVV